MAVVVVGIVLDAPAVALSSAVSRFWLCGGAYIIELLSTVFYLFFCFFSSLLPTRPSQISSKYSRSAFPPPPPPPPQSSVFSAAGVHASVYWFQWTGNTSDLVVFSCTFRINKVATSRNLASERRKSCSKEPQSCTEDSHPSPAGSQFKNHLFHNCPCLALLPLSLSPVTLAIYRVLHCRCPRVLQFLGELKTPRPKSPRLSVVEQQQKDAEQDGTDAARPDPAQQQQQERQACAGHQHRTAAKVKHPPPHDEQI